MAHFANDATATQRVLIAASPALQNTTYNRDAVGWMMCKSGEPAAPARPSAQGGARSVRRPAHVLRRGRRPRSSPGP
jgi:hypothetical protein